MRSASMVVSFDANLGECSINPFIVVLSLSAGLATSYQRYVSVHRS